jgi:hypothetical protein
MLTVSCGAKPLPETVTRPPQFAVAGVIVRAAFGVGVAVGVGVGVAVAVAVGVGVAVAVAVGVNAVVAVGVGVSVVAVGVGVSVGVSVATGSAGSVAALVMGARVAPLAVRLPISTSAAKAAPMRRWRLKLIGPRPPGQELSAHAATYPWHAVGKDGRKWPGLSSVVGR